MGPHPRHAPARRHRNHRASAARNPERPPRPHPARAHHASPPHREPGPRPGGQPTRRTGPLHSPGGQADTDGRQVIRLELPVSTP
jgi:hypothetical protein